MHIFFKIVCTSRLNVSGNHLRSRGKNKPSIKRVSILEGASDITRVSNFFKQSSFRSLLHWSINVSQTKRNWRQSVSPISIFRCKPRNKMLLHKSQSISTSIIIFLLVNLKVIPSLAKQCIFCIFILSSTFLGLFLHSEEQMKCFFISCFTCPNAE